MAGSEPWGRVEKASGQPAGKPSSPDTEAPPIPGLATTLQGTQEGQQGPAAQEKTEANCLCLGAKPNGAQGLTPGYMLKDHT